MNSFYPLTIFAKSFIIDVWQSPKYTFVMFHTKLFPEKAKHKNLYLAKYEKEYVIKLATKQEYASTISFFEIFHTKNF